LGLILGGGLMALWGIYGSAPRKQPQADVAANASNETAQAIKDLQTTQQKMIGELQSVHQTLTSAQGETKQAIGSEQADTKRISDQVTALSGKLDALQQSFASAQQQSPAPAEPPPAPAKRRR
jgi:Spy/CpxP family protein refolding chaperone